MASRLLADTNLVAEEHLDAGRYRLRVQGDGNVVLYRDDAVIWATHTSGVGAYLRMQSDGNLVLRDASGVVLWAAHTAVDTAWTVDDPCRYAELLDTGSFIVVDDSRRFWPVTPADSAPPLPVVTLPRLVANGQFFALETGVRWTGIEASDFNLLNRYLDGEDIEPVLRQRAALGFNLLRVWTLYDLMAPGLTPIGRLTLADHPDLYDRIPAFLERCAAHGLYVEFTAYTDIMDMRHWPRLGGAVQWQTNVILEYCNEAHVPDQWQTHQRITGVLCSHGSDLSEQDPIRPWWDYETTHWNGASEWQRKIGHDSMEYSAGAEGIEASHVPILANENTRFPDNDQSCAHAYDAAAGAALLCAGSCFHSVSGKNSTLWTGLELDCARTWAEGARSVPLRAQLGRYIHRTDLEASGALRVYERRLDDGWGHIVYIGY